MPSPYYVSALASGGAGTIGDPWDFDTWAALSTTLLVTDTINILNDGAYTATVRLTNPKGLVTGPSMSDRPTITWVGAGANGHSSGANSMLRYLIFDDGGIMYNAVYSTQANSVIFGVKCLSGEIFVNNTDAYCMYCEVADEYIYGSGGVYYCYAVGPIYSAESPIVGCISSGSATDGIGSGNRRSYYRNCIAYNATANGFEDNPASTGVPIFENCIAVNNGGYGFANGAQGGTFINCYGFNNTSGDVENTPYMGGVTALAADPFVDAASGDFRFNDTAGGGRVLRAAGLTDFPGLASTKYWPFNWLADADTVGPDEADVSDGVTYGVNAARTGTLAVTEVDVFGGALSASTSLTPALSASVDIP